MTCERSIVPRIWAVVVFATIIVTPAVADFNKNDILSRVVRIEVKTSGKDRVGSGFIWKTRDHVVTSLHTVLGQREIKVQCLQAERKATIASVHARADLALLKTDHPFPDNCKPFESVMPGEPGDGQTLHTMGFKSHSIAATTRNFTKEWASPPVTIARLVGKNGNVLSDLRRLGTPDVDNLPIYYVQGGLLPGYSGAPIFDGNGNLVGIVDGGLNGGTTDFNWAIPGKHLNDLPSMGLGNMPSSGGDMTGTLFSYGGGASETKPVIAYETDDWNYQWVKTKTVSLAEVLRYSDTLDLDSVRELLADHPTVFGANAENRLRFDIYEDIDNGLVIAAPEGHALVVEDEWLVSYPADRRLGSIQYQMLPWGLDTSGRPPAPIYNEQTGEFYMPAQAGGTVWPTDPGYFDALIGSLHSECNVEGESSCFVVEDSKEVYDYGAGNKVLNIAFDVQEGEYPAHYEHYSFAVRGLDDIAFQTYARIEWVANDIYNCIKNPRSDGCYNSATAFTNLQQILAVSMSSTSRFQKPQAPMDFGVE